MAIRLWDVTGFSYFSDFFVHCVNGTPGHGDINAGAVGNHL